MLTFMLITLGIIGATKATYKQNPEVIASRIDDGVSTREEQERYIKRAEKILAKAERKAKRLEDRRLARLQERENW